MGLINFGINSLIILGLFISALLFLFSLYNPTNLVLNKFYWWWMAHFWFEAVWLLIISAMLAFVLIRITGINRDIVEKWLYIIATMIFVTGFISIGHHYYWIGAPKYWQWWGSAFSLMQPIPLFLIALFVFTMVRKRQIEHPNKAALLWVTGTAVIAFLGAGLWGLIHTLAPINYFTHGTQIEVAYTHIAIYGAYAMTIFMMISYAMPTLRNRKANNERAQVVEMWSFWLLTLSMVFATIFLTIAGVLQVYMQRYTDVPQPFMVVQERIAFFYWLREFVGVIFLIGFIVYVASFFVKQHRRLD